jgi:hypothetical protein
MVYIVLSFGVTMARLSLQAEASQIALDHKNALQIVKSDCKADL